MEIYFELPDVGELAVEHSFYLLDGEPILFVCRDTKGNRYLCSCYQMDKNWVIGQVEEMALLDLIDDQVTIREVFERYCSRRWTAEWDGEGFRFEGSVSDDVLPKKGALLELESEKNGRYAEILEQSRRQKLLERAPRDPHVFTCSPSVQCDRTDRKMLKDSMLLWQTDSIDLQLDKSRQILVKHTIAHEKETASNMMQPSANFAAAA